MSSLAPKPLFTTASNWSIPQVTTLPGSSLWQMSCSIEATLYPSGVHCVGTSLPMLHIITEGELRKWRTMLITSFSAQSLKYRW